MHNHIGNGAGGFNGELGGQEPRKSGSFANGHDPTLASPPHGDGLLRLELDSIRGKPGTNAGDLVSLLMVANANEYLVRECLLTLDEAVGFQREARKRGLSMSQFVESLAEAEASEHDPEFKMKLL
jgi:hypothetical protein